MIPTLFPFDDASIIEKITRMYEVRCSPWIQHQKKKEDIKVVIRNHE